MISKSKCKWIYIQDRNAHNFSRTREFNSKLLKIQWIEFNQLPFVLSLSFSSVHFQMVSPVALFAQSICTAYDKPQMHLDSCSLFISCRETIYVMKQTSYFHYLADIAWGLQLQLCWLYLKVTFIRNSILSVFRKIWDINTSPNRHPVTLPHTSPVSRDKKMCLRSTLILQTKETETLVPTISVHFNSFCKAWQHSFHVYQ